MSKRLRKQRAKQRRAQPAAPVVTPRAQQVSLRRAQKAATLAEETRRETLRARAAAPPAYDLLDTSRHPLARYEVLHYADINVADRTAGPIWNPDALSYFNRAFLRDRAVETLRPLDVDDALEALWRLQPTYAAAVERCCVDHATERVAAAALGVSQQTLHYRKQRGLTLLARWLRPPDVPSEGAPHASA